MSNISKNSQDYYEILGVTKKCSDEDIKKAYRKLAMKWHPDKHVHDSEKDKAFAEETFKEINRAYEILGDPEKRKKYDLSDCNSFSNTSDNDYNYQFTNANDIFNKFFSTFGNDGFDFDYFSGLNGLNGFNSFNVFHDPVANNIKPNVFVNNTPGRRIHINFGRTYNYGSKNSFDHNVNDEDTYFGNNITKVQDEPIFTDVYVTLEELYTGVEKKIKISRQINTKNSSKTETEILTIDVKPGWKEGTKITFNNKGNVNIGTEPADMIFVIKQKPHDVFKREGNNLTTTFTITKKESVFGFERTIVNLKGENLVINLKKKVIHDTYFHTVFDEGMPIRKEGTIIGYGNLIIKFIIINKGKNKL